MAGGAGSAIGRGGMLTKILAAKRAARSGASTVIACGREPDVLTRLAAGEAIGTTLIAGRTSLAARKQWLADHVRLAGRLMLDGGAVRALTQDGKSLLPIGVVAVDRQFRPRRGRRLRRTRRARDRARPRQLRRAGSGADRAQAVVGDRSDAGLRRRAGADPPGQSRAARLSARSTVDRRSPTLRAANGPARDRMPDTASLEGSTG